MHEPIVALPGMTDTGPTVLSGRMIMPAYDCWYPPAVEVNDLLDVDFDQRDIGTDGLYLVEIVEGGRITWRGCRRFQVMPSGLWIDLSGEGEWKQIESPASLRLRVVGCVCEVYKPASRIDEIIGRTIAVAARNLTRKEVSNVA